MAESIVQVTEGAGKKLHTWQRTIGANVVEDEVVLLGEQYLAAYRVRASNVSIATDNSHDLQIMAGASLRVYVRHIWVYQRVLATTATIFSLEVLRLTTAGTGGTAITPAPHDPADAASGATAMTLPTVKGTEGTSFDVADAYALQTVTATPPQGRALLAEFDYSGLHAKSLVIAAGATNGIVVKHRGAVAAATVEIIAEIVEANF